MPLFLAWCCLPALFGMQPKGDIASGSPTLAVSKLPSRVDLRSSKRVVCRESRTHPFVVDEAVVRPVAFALCVGGIHCHLRNPLSFVCFNESARRPT